MNETLKVIGWNTKGYQDIIQLIQRTFKRLGKILCKLKKFTKIEEEKKGFSYLMDLPKK